MTLAARGQTGVGGVTVRVVIADGNPVVRMGFRSLLEATEVATVVGEAGTGDEACELVRRLRPDVVLLDVRMPERDGLAVLPDLAAMARVLVVTYRDDDETVTAAMLAGATGFLVHGSFTADELTRAVLDSGSSGRYLSPSAAEALVRSAATRAAAPEDRPGTRAGPGRVLLSPREREVMDLVARGRTNAAIAQALFLSEKTVKNHLNHIYVKLRAHSRAEAIVRWLGL
jgi:DNA-binding NarL/FixJ family response regulator